MLRLDAGQGPRFVEPPQSLVPERLDYGSREPHCASRNNRLTPFEACGHQEQDHSQEVGGDDTRNLRAIAANPPSDREERHRAHKPGDQRNRPEVGAEGGGDQQHPKQPEEHCPVLQQDPNVRIVRCNSVQASELACPEDAG